jgi:glycosyltransferase involved in cell wall biosynthesis
MQNTESPVAPALREAQPRRPKLLFLVTEDWYFCSHRLPLARAARDAHFDVVVATRVTDHGAQILAEGFKLIPIHLSRRSKNPIREVAFLRELFRIYREERPDIVHHVAVKPVLYGSLVARAARVPATVNALAGMGYLFSSSQMTARLLRPLVVQAYRLALDGDRRRLIVQNPDDAHLLQQLGVVGPRTQPTIIRGSGVDMTAYPAQPEPPGVPLVILPARMLWDKGVVEFVDAARLLKGRGIEARFALVGDADVHNPAAISPEELRDWQEEGVVEWWGFRSDMPAVLASCHIVCLPSYREGLPKALLEAASSGRPIVATDVPGCREIVRNEDNGLLVPLQDAEALANALERLIRDGGLRARMGARGRERVAAEFRVEKVIEDTLGLYRELAGHSSWGRRGDR